MRRLICFSISFAEGCSGSTVRILCLCRSAFPDMTQYLPFPSEWADTPSPYGPLWEWTAAGLARTGDGTLLRSLFTFKYFGLVCYLVCIGLILAILRRRRAAKLVQATIAFG